MNPDTSIAFFDRQFRQQVQQQDFELNPFERLILPHLKGCVLDFGCGLGNLSLAAAARGCSVLALDASPTAIAHLRQRAKSSGLELDAIEADLRTYPVDGYFDSVVSVGLLMFFDCASALHTLSMLQDCVRPGGIAAVNVLVEGTTYLDMFQPGQYCLFSRHELGSRFAGWNGIHSEYSEFDAPGNTVKCFATIIARKSG